MANPYHYPAGDKRGGQFAPKGTDIIVSLNSKFGRDVLEARSETITEVLGDLTGKCKIDDVKKERKALEKMSESDYLDYLKITTSEAKVTGDLRENIDGLISLETRVKSPSSTYEKIYERQKYRSVQELSDILRYTSIKDENTYTKSVKKDISKLEKKGYVVVKQTNYWKDATTGYNGINYCLLSPDSVKVELQFHTEESHKCKETELHELYEQERIEKDPIKKEELRLKQREVGSKVKVPDKVHSI